MNAGAVEQRVRDAVGERQLRQAVREWLREQREGGAFEPHCDAWVGRYDIEFSRRVASLGLVGMTWPARYGGGERSALERFVVTEELLCAGAPVGAHWVGDRQIGPTLLRFGTEEQRERFLPALTKVDAIFALGFSEPDAGSDLASIRTAGERVDGGWCVNGVKVWSSGAHIATHADVLVRTAKGERKQEGLSEVIVDLASPGVTVRPIRHMSGAAHFNEVIFEDVFVPDAMVVGAANEGWSQITSQLAYERSGPERVFSTWPLFAELVAGCDVDDRAAAIEIGTLLARFASLHKLSYGIATALERGEAPITQAALVKDLGTRLEFDVIDSARRLVPGEQRSATLERLIEEAVYSAPGASLRGGTNEILRGIVARRTLGVK